MQRFSEQDDSESLESLENLICQSPLVRFCMIVGYDRPYLSALIGPDKAALSEMLGQADPSFTYNLDTYRGLNHIDARSHYCDLIEAVNKKSEGKTIERFALVEWETARSRDALLADHRIIIESFYQEFIPGIG